MAELRAHEYQSPEAEQAVLGCCLLSPDSIATAIEFNRAGHFYIESHQAVFRAIVRLYEKGPMDSALISSFLKKEKVLKEDPIMLLAQLQAAGCIPSTMERHCKLVREQWARRELIYKLSGHLQNAQSSNEGSGHLIDGIAQDMIDLHESGDDNGPRLAKYDINEVDQIVKKKDRGLTTGLTDLDGIIGGWKAGDVYVFAGRPSMGKTALSVKFAHSLTFKHAVPTLVFTLEMTREQYLLRTVALEAKLSSFDLQHHGQTEEEMERYEASRDALALVPLVVDGTAGISISTIRYRTRAEKRRHGIKVIVIDYLQIVTYDGENAWNREQEVARIADGMKSLAKDLDIAVIALAQVSRETERREAQRPRLTDLRESGAIEQMADVVGFIHRPEYYGTTYLEEYGNVEGKAFVFIDKDRNGPTGEVQLYWNKNLACFEEYPP